MNTIRNNAGEKIDTTFHPGTNSERLVVLGHGLTGNKDRPLLVALADGLAAHGWPCLRISYSGNGASEGRFVDSCVSKGVDDLISVLDTVPAGTRIAYAGHSMGGAVGVLAAASDPRIRVLVSLAGMTHTAGFAEREFGQVVPGAGCMWDEEEFPLSRGFLEDLRGIDNTLGAAATITQPWLLVHGSADDLVPAQDSTDAFAAARGPKDLLCLEGAGHAFDATTYPAIIASMHRWLGQYLG